MFSTIRLSLIYLKHVLIKCECSQNCDLKLLIKHNLLCVLVKTKQSVNFTVFDNRHNLSMQCSIYCYYSKISNRASKPSFVLVCV
jgi:hypothetical protein